MMRLGQVRLPLRPISDALLLAALVLSCLVPTGAAADDTGVHRALFIGINEYESDAISDLRGALNDVELIRSVLETRYGFQRENVSVLTDRDATRAGILAALEKLVGESGPEDFVYIHFSGHGSQVDDLDGDEADDGLDETIIPHDARTAGIPDITDDELNTILADLDVRGALIVLDSCHSGTATRDAVIRTRSLPPDERIELYRTAAPRTRAVVPLVGERYVLMTGAAAHQSALDGPLDGRYYGFFSHALGRSLAALPAGSTPTAIHDGVVQELADVQDRFGGIAMPEPQLEASSARLVAPLFTQEAGGSAGGATGAGQRVTFRVTIEDDAIRLHGGRGLDAAPGSYWALFDAGPDQRSDGRPLGVVFVSVYDGNDSLAQIVEHSGAIPEEVLGVPVMEPAPSTAIPVRLLGGDRDQRERFSERIRAVVPAVEFVGEEQFARFIIDISGEGCRVSGLGGLQEIADLPPCNETGTVAAVANILRRSANATALQGLENPSARMALTVAAVGAVRVGDGTGMPVYRYRRPDAPISASNSLMLSIRASVDCFVTIVDVQPDGAVNLLFPNTYQNQDFHPEGSIPGRQEVRIPDNHDADNAAGFLWPCGPPAGLETIRVFACTDIEDARIIRRYLESLQTAARSSDGHVSDRSVDPASESTLAGLRNELAVRAGARGFGVVASDPGTPPTDTPEEARTSDWTAATCRVRIME